MIPLTIPMIPGFGRSEVVINPALWFTMVYSSIKSPWLLVKSHEIPVFAREIPIECLLDPMKSQSASVLVPRRTGHDQFHIFRHFFSQKGSRLGCGTTEGRHHALHLERACAPSLGSIWHSSATG